MPTTGTPRSWIWKALEESAGSILTELGIRPVDAVAIASVTELCSCCNSDRDLHNSTAKYSNTFCSEQCEQAFIRGALASITVEDCIRMQARLEALLLRTQECAARV